MNKLLNILLLAMFAAGVGSCTKDAGSEPAVTPEETRSNTLTFGFEQPVTYAVDTWAMEKRLRSIAIFIECADGSFHKFFNSYDAATNVGFTDVEYYIVRDPDTNEQLAHVSEASLELPSDADYVSNVAIVGNYWHRDADLTADLMAITSWNELAAYKAPAASRGVFLNPAHLAFKVFTPIEIAQLVTNQNMQIEMERLAARIRPDFKVLAVVGDEAPYDIGNWHALDHKNVDLFHIKTLIFYNPKSATYLLPDLVAQADITAIPQLEKFDPTEDFNGYSRDLYVYEMTGDEPEPLAIYLVYEYRANKNEAFQEAITGITIENTANGKCVLRHNHAYEVDFPITIPVPAAVVSEWDNGWGLAGRP